MLLIYQGREKQIHIGKHNTSFSAPLPLGTHALFIYCYDHTVFIHFLEKNFNDTLTNLTSQHAKLLP